MRNLFPELLTAKAFSPYGDVIERRGAEQRLINDGLTMRYHDLARVDVTEEGGRALINIFRSKPISLPHQIKLMERHPLGSQAFIPMGRCPFLVLVAPPGDRLNIDELRLFITNGMQGVNYDRNCWHHYLMAIDEESEFIVIDRGGKGNNLAEVELFDETVMINEVGAAS